MNTNEILDRMFEIFEGTNSKENIDGEFDIGDIRNLLEEDRIAFTGYKPIPEFYKKLEALVNKREMLLSALESDSKDRNTIGNIFVEISPLSFFSAEEIDELLNSDKLKELKLDGSKVIASLIHATGNPSKYLTPENMNKFKLDRYSILRLVCKSHDCRNLLTPYVIKKVNGGFKMMDTSKVCNFLVENIVDFKTFLIPENINKLRLPSSAIVTLIKASGNIEEYLTPENIEKFGLDISDVAELIAASGNIEKYLTLENAEKFGLIPENPDYNYVIRLIEVSGNIEKYLTPENMKKFGLDSWKIVKLIRASGSIEKYLTPENIGKFGLDISDVVELIEASGNIEKYLTPESIEQLHLSSDNVVELIKANGNIEKYLTQESVEQLHLSSDNVVGLIKASGNIEKYLTREGVEQLHLSSDNVVGLIKASGNIEKYLTREGVEQLHLSSDNVVELIEASGNIEKYLTREDVEKLHLTSGDAVRLIKVILKVNWEELSFQLIKEHPEWKYFFYGRDISEEFPPIYGELFKRFDSETVIKLGIRDPETIDNMVLNGKTDILQSWYKATGGRFVPNYVVMLNFPQKEIDNFLGNSKKWSQLMRIDNNLNSDNKAAILKASYAMGVFHGNDDGFNKVMKLFTDVPVELSQEEYEKVERMFEITWKDGKVSEDIPYDKKAIKTFEESYTFNKNGKYVLGIDKQKNKDTVRLIRKILEYSNIGGILTQEKAHQIFDSFSMEYNPDFVRFFNENIEKILTSSEYIKIIAAVQRQFKDIVRLNAGRSLTLNEAIDYVKKVAYTNIDIGNESVAEQAKIVGYSQKDFEAIQSLFNEGELRDFSSIPRIQGSTKGYTYEMLRCDDPLALTIGTLTDCCQEIHSAGATSMEHSVVSPDGRVFCVRDEEGRVVAQSWFWRNQYTGCFDNIEIPNRIFELYEKKYPDIGRKGLTTNVLEVYKKAAQDLMQEDARVYQELLKNGTITQEQYDALLLGKVTIGLGYNDIADAIKADEAIHKETAKVRVKKTDRFPHLYTDAEIQYTIAERENTIKSEYENLYVHQDDLPVFDGTNMSNMVLLTIRRMEQATEKNNLAYISEESDEKNLSKSQKIINSIAREYGFEPNDTRVIATARIAIIYSKDKDNKVKIGEVLSSPLKENLTREQKQNVTAHIMYQVKKALKQIGIQDSEIDLSLLSEEQQQELQAIIQEIKKENDERGER